MKKLLFLLAFAIAGCSSKPDQNAAKEDVAMLSSPPSASAGGAEQMANVSTDDRKIIRNASLDFRVKNVEDSSKKIGELVKKNNGRIASTQETRSNDRLYVRMSIQIPEDKLDAFLNTLLEESIYTENKSIESEDVTKQFIDLNARIKSKKATEEKYLELLKKARNVEEVLKVEEQLRIMREEIEVQEAFFKELKENIALSRVNANFYQELEPGKNPGTPYLEEVWNSFIKGFSLVMDLFSGFVLLLPALVVIGIIVWLIKRWKNRPQNTRD